MKYIVQYFFSYVKKHFIKFISMIFLYFICTFFIIGQSLYIYSYVLTSEENKNSSFGIFDFIAVSEQEEKLNKIVNENEIGKINVNYIGENEENKEFFIGQTDANGKIFSKIHTVSGKFPSEKNEIALEKRTLTLLYPEADVGDNINITVNGTNKTYILSGIIADLSINQWKEDNNSYNLPQGYISDNISEPIFSFYLIKTNNENIYEELCAIFSPELIQQNHGDENSIYAFMGINEKFYSTLSFLISVSIVIIILIVIVSSNKTEEEQKIGILKLAGFSDKELYKYFIVECSFEIIPGLISGSLSGILITKLIVDFLKNIDFYYDIKNIIVILSLNFILLFIFSMIGKKKSIRNNICSNLNSLVNTKDENRKCNFDSNNPAVLYSVKSYVLRSGASATTALLILFSLIIFSVGIFGASAINYKVENSLPVDYFINIYNGWYDNKTSYIPLEPFCGMSETDLKMIENCEDIKNSIPIKLFGMFTINNGEGIYVTKEDKEFYGFDKDDNLTPVSLIGMKEKDIKQIIKFSEKKDLDCNMLNSGKQVIAIKNDEFSYSIGDEIELTQAILFNGVVERTVRFNVIITDVLDTELLPKSTGLYSILKGADFIWDEQSFDKKNIPLNYRNVCISLKDSKKTENINVVLDEIEKIYKEKYNTQILRKVEERAQLRYIADNFISVSSICSFSLISIAFIGISVNIRIRTKQRKKILGTLRACGLTLKEYRKIAICETFLEHGIPVIIGNIISFISCCLLNYSIFNVPYSEIPYVKILLLSLVFVCLIVLVSYVASRQFFKIPIVECLDEKE